jgi:predicted dehydrogenase
MLNGINLDAVVIATGVARIIRWPRPSLLAGKHTFIEKPMASSVAQCEELVDLARKQGIDPDDRPHVSVFPRGAQDQGDH